MAGTSSGNPIYTPTGQQWQEGGLAPDQDATGAQGTPMLVEDYDPDYNFQVRDTELHGGRTMDELYDGVQILGYPVKSAGLSNNKFLKFSSANAGEWVIADPSGTTNMADLADFNPSATQNQYEAVTWNGTLWDSTELNVNNLQNPLNGLRCGATSGTGTLMISAINNQAKKLVFQRDNANETYSDLAGIKVSESDSRTPSGLIFEVGSTHSLGISTDGILQLSMSHSSAPTADEGGMYYNNVSKTWFFGIDDGQGSPA